MRIVAILDAWNEERFIVPSLEHWIGQGCEVLLIDDGSTDRTAELAEPFRGSGLIDIISVQRRGVFELARNLGRKEEIAAQLDADWLIHSDPDEIRLSPWPGWTLAEAIREVDARGYNAINFFEYTFVPTQEEPDHDHLEFMRTMRGYYPFAPSFPHRLNAWRKQPERVDLVSSGGHRVQFEGLRMYPAAFPMRHYQFLSLEHALEKYGSRVYDRDDLERRKWHGWRARFCDARLSLPARCEVKTYESDAMLDPSNPWTTHWLDRVLTGGASD